VEKITKKKVWLMDGVVRKEGRARAQKNKAGNAGKIGKNEGETAKGSKTERGDEAVGEKKGESRKSRSQAEKGRELY